jgi:hypothetical protein
VQCSTRTRYDVKSMSCARLVTVVVRLHFRSRNVWGYLRMETRRAWCWGRTQGHGTPSESKSPPDGRASGTVRRSVDGGKTWEASVVLNGHQAYSYSCLSKVSSSDTFDVRLKVLKLGLAQQKQTVLSAEDGAWRGSQVPQPGHIGLAFETVLPGSGVPDKWSANNVVFALIPQNFSNSSVGVAM